MPEKEYIERNKALLAVNQFYHIPKVDIAIRNIPTADVVEVKHGEWKWGYGLGGRYGIWCSNCGAGWEDSPNAEWIALEHDYCGKCGAKMDGKEKGESKC